MSKTLKILIGVSLVLGVLGLVLPRYQFSTIEIPSLGGTTRASTTVAGNFSTTASTTIGNIGTQLDSISSYTATWNPTSTAPMATSTIAVSSTQAVVGDPCFAGLDSVSSSFATAISIDCHVRATGEVLVKLQNVQTTSTVIDVPTGTLRIVIFKF